MNDSLQASASRTLGALFSDYSGPSFAIRLWDGWTWRSSAAVTPACTIVFSSPKALTLLMLDPSQVALGEAFIHRDIDLEGDIFSVFEMAQHVLMRPLPLRDRAFQALGAMAHAVLHGPIHSRGRDRASIAYHYDQPVEFYRPWLGPTLVYSCAYFRHPDDSLDIAQTRKLDHICRKLRLRPGERFLDVGCGWGSLVLQASAQYGADAHGITLSQIQAQVAGQRIAEHSLHGRCRVSLQDYRELDSATVAFDKIASVGMSEHVGLKNLPAYFSIVHRRLRPGGVFLNHAIARSALSTPRGNDSFISKYVFPDGALTTLTETVGAAESAGFEVRDVENLREHYARTLRCWVEGLRAAKSTLRQHVSEETYRIWLLYMAGCSAAFRRGDIGVYQVLLSRPDKGNSGLPLTRDDWYTEDAAETRWQPGASIGEPAVTGVLN